MCSLHRHDNQSHRNLVGLARPVMKVLISPVASLTSSLTRPYNAHMHINLIGFSSDCSLGHILSKREGAMRARRNQEILPMRCEEYRVEAHFKGPWMYIENPSARVMAIH